MAGPRLYSRKIVVFPQFDGGELGRRGVTKPQTGGQFTANNMLVNYRGNLMVRPGLKKFNPAGLATGVVQGFGSTSVPGRDVWFIQGTAVRAFGLNGGALSTAVTALSATPTLPADWTMAGSAIHFVINKPTGAQPQGGVYTLDPVPTPITITRRTNSYTARCITFYGDRLVVGNVFDTAGGNTNTIRWNGTTGGVSDFTVWNALDFINVGDPWVVTALDWQRQHLLIAKQNQWHILTNATGSGLEVVRKVSSTAGPLFPYLCSLDSKDDAWYQDLNTQFPSKFSGTYPSFYRNMEYTGGTVVSGVDQLPPLVGNAAVAGQSDGAVYISNSGSASYINKIWTKHTFGVTISGYVAPTGGGPNPGSSRVIICDGGGAAATPNFYVWDCTLDTPGIEGGTFSRAGDDSATPVVGSVTFPEHWDEGLGEIQVRSVIVDFMAYANGSGANDTFDLTLNVLRRYEAGDALSSTASFSSAATNFSASGTRQRKIFGFNDAGMGNGFSLQFANIRGIEIERVEVVLEDHPVRMGT